ncbi:MAG: aminoacyl-histidine dipeptidase [Clostridia bacterium]|nr:aminoacyl-histidine dipeptidase [Clostridia bacterium]
MANNYLDFFRALCAIPHGSGNTAGVSDYCEAFAKRRGLRCIREACGNILIFKDGTGAPDAEPVILQGHLDMVCAARPGKRIDFLTEGLTLRQSGDFLLADGTSLGGDDGIAVAYALAILDSDTLVHPPLEVVFTVDEETGMNGAMALDTAPLRGRMLINVDSEEEGTLLTSCAGGARADLTWRGERAAVSDTAALRVTLSGFLGGHSGTEIDKSRQNAILVLAKLLAACGVRRLASIGGGTADNAIPSVAAAVLPGGAAPADRLRKAFDAMKPAFLPAEQAAVLTAEPATVTDAFTEDATKNLLDFLCGVPDGVIAMSADVPDLVQTSLNLGILKTDGETVTSSHALRSSVDAEKAALIGRLTDHAARYGANCSTHSAYPAWEFRPHSRLRDAFCAAYADLYGKELRLSAIHAGLECGIFCGKVPGLDCVSMGPDIFDIHSPDERLSLPSAERTYRLLCAVLKALAG